MYEIKQWNYGLLSAVSQLQILILFRKNFFGVVYAAWLALHGERECYTVAYTCSVSPLVNSNIPVQDKTIPIMLEIYLKYDFYVAIWIDGKLVWRFL